MFVAFLVGNLQVMPRKQVQPRAQYSRGKVSTGLIMTERFKATRKNNADSNMMVNGIILQQGA